MNPQPITLLGRHVRLEPLTQAHAADLLAVLTNDPSIWQWMPSDTPDTLRTMEAFLTSELAAQEAGQILLFTQIEQTSGKVVGSTKYLNISRRDRGLEIGGTWIGKPWQRTAINTEAKYLLLRHAFEDLGAVRVQLKTDGRNLQSQTAIERLGARFEGVLRKHMLVRDGFIRDTVMYSIIDSEWPQRKAELEEKMTRSATCAPPASPPTSKTPGPPYDPSRPVP
jgi:RimJ/RimL family protein N-acetyltransferase